MQLHIDGYCLEVLLTAVNSAAPATYGYDHGVIGGIIISERFLSYFSEVQEIHLKGLLVSIHGVRNLK